jgi:Tfp pilus assembly protein PilO
VVAAGGWFLGLSPVLDEARQARTEAETTEHANDTRRLEAARLAAEMAELPQREAELAEMRRQFPSGLELEPFVQRLADLSWRSGATVQRVSRSEPRESDSTTGASAGMYEVEVTLVVEGTTEQHLQYLSDLQAVDDRLFLVTAFRGLNTGEATFTATVFVLLDADKIVAAAPEEPAAVEEEDGS